MASSPTNSEEQSYVEMSHEHVQSSASSLSSHHAVRPQQAQAQARSYPQYGSITMEHSYFTVEEIAKLRQMLRQYDAKPMPVVTKDGEGDIGSVSTKDSEYPEFPESTHAWAVFADHPQKRAGIFERVVGTLIICFQLFTYWIYAQEAIEDYDAGQVFVQTSHADCLASDEEPADKFTCDANFTNDLDAFCAFFMLGIFMTGDFLQVARVIRAAPRGMPLLFACLAGIEVVCAYLSACVSVSYNLYIGEVTDAVEVGVGLLFIRELSQRAYSGIYAQQQDTARGKKAKHFKIFFAVLALLVVFGMISDPLCEFLFAAPLQYQD